VTVSVVICAYNLERWDELTACVRSIQRQSHPPHEIIVVIDHNENLEARARAGVPGVEVVANTEDRGLSGARNTGIANARGEVVAFIDDDAVADIEWLSRLVAPFADRAVLGVGGSVVPNWMTGKPAWFPEEFNWVVGCSYTGLPVTAAPIRNFIGCNMSFRRTVFDDIGGFVSGIGRVDKVPVGCEETELCIRARQARPDGKLLFEPSAVVHHNVPAERTTWAYYRSRCLAEGLSKAKVTQAVGSGDGLGSERTYVTRTLPAGVMRHGTQALLGRDRAGWARAGSIIAGLGLTTAGYLRARWRGRREPSWSPRLTVAARG
jgi:GT2 family glycosyltransferase